VEEKARSKLAARFDSSTFISSRQETGKESSTFCPTKVHKSVWRVYSHTRGRHSHPGVLGRWEPGTGSEMDNGQSQYRERKGIVWGETWLWHTFHFCFHQSASKLRPVLVSVVDAEPPNELSSVPHCGWMQLSASWLAGQNAKAVRIVTSHAMKVGS